VDHRVGLDRVGGARGSHGLGVPSLNPGLLLEPLAKPHDLRIAEQLRKITQIGSDEGTQQQPAGFDGHGRSHARFGEYRGLGLTALGNPARILP
jgi:hypothetical protein